jgi:lipopolysaccharide O-acetyltransferase
MKKIIEKIKFLGVLGCFRLVRDILFSTMFFKVGALIRHPFYVRSLGRLNVGSDCRAGPGLVVDILDKNAFLKIGYGFRSGSRLHIGCLKSVTIGNNVLIASDVFISDHSHGNYGESDCDAPITVVNKRKLMQKDVFIDDNVWIGEKVCILPGVNIGKNTIIGAGSIVTSSIPANSIVVGSPAKCIKKYDFFQNKWIKS